MLRNALIPVATVIGPALAALITGSFIIETLFAVNGIGRLYVESIGPRDYSMIMGTTLFYALIVALANVMVDVVTVSSIRASSRGSKASGGIRHYEQHGLHADTIP